MQNDFTVPDDWHENFFTAPVNRFWEKAIPPEAALADRHIGAPPPVRLLDIPCGAGLATLVPYADADGTPYAAGNPRLLLVAERLPPP